MDLGYVLEAEPRGYTSGLEVRCGMGEKEEKCEERG